MLKTKNKTRKKSSSPLFYSVAISTCPKCVGRKSIFVHLFVPTAICLFHDPSSSSSSIIHRRLIFLLVILWCAACRLVRLVDWERPQDGVYFFLSLIYLFLRKMFSPLFVSCCYSRLSLSHTQLHTHTLFRFISWWYDGDDLCFCIPPPLSHAVLNKVDGCEKT